ncbi:MAG: dTDP-4-dehydrorhamnose reductase [Candidatus Omnitrophota bacterium]
MKFVIFGAKGQLGREFQKKFMAENIPFAAADIDTCDIADPAAVSRLIGRERPSVVINCAAYNLVDKAEDDPVSAFKVNADAVRHMAAGCASGHVKLIHYGSDYVFNGRKGALYVETDATDPLNVYGQSKLAGEKNALAASPRHLVLRTSWVIGPGEQNFLFKLRQWAAKSDTLKISGDEISVPTFTATIVNCTLAAVKEDLTGLYHLTNSGCASRIDLARAFLDEAGIKGKELTPVPMASFGLKAARPVFAAMSNDAITKALGIDIPSWQDALRGYVATYKMDMKEGGA